MQKRGQITTFIIIGIVILAAVALAIYFRGAQPLARTTPEAPPDVAPVQSFVQSCLQQVLSQGLYNLGYQGGYDYLPADYANLNQYGNAYLYNQGQNELLSLEDMNFEFFFFLRQNMPTCTKNFENFQGYNISGEITNLSSTFTDNGIIFRVSYPLEIRKGSAVSRISDFNVEIPVRLKYIHNVTSELLKRSLAVAPYLIDLDYLRGVGLNVTVIAYENNTIVYSLVDEKSRLMNAPYVFVFSSKVEPNYAITNDTIGIRIKNGTVYADLLK